MKTLIATCILSAAPLAAVAGGFTPPEGCELRMTVQHHGCTLSHHYVCEGDAPGDQRASFADTEGVYYETRIDAETRWVESRSVIDGEVTHLLPDAHDHASFSSLLREGRDDFDFSVVSDLGEIRRYRGEDRLTGAVRVIDGVPLEVTEFEVERLDADGLQVYRRKGTEFIHRDMRLFFGGTEEMTTAEGELIHSEDSPAAFAFPGEPGFAASEPEFDCDALLARSAPETPQGDPQDARI